MSPPFLPRYLVFSWLISVYSVQVPDEILGNAMQTPGHTPDTGEADHRTFCRGPLCRFLRALFRARPSGASRAPSSGELFGHCLGRARQAPVFPLRTLIAIATHSFGDQNVAWRSHPTLKSSNVRISVHLRIRFPQKGRLRSLSVFWFPCAVLI